MTGRLASQYHGLPYEIWEEVLSFVDASLHSATVLSLSRALPGLQLSTRHLFVHTNICTSKQTKALIARLSNPQDGSVMRSAVRSFILSSWSVDEYVVSNLIASFRQLRHLQVNIGPRWDPEAVSDLLAKPFEEILSITFRFNLYLRMKNYLSFLKGQYFDIVLTRLAQWPANERFTRFSFVQDLPPELPINSDASTEEGQAERATKFAQPLVLFKTYSIGHFGVSPFAANIKYLRFRIPNRSLLSSITSPQTTTTVLPASSNGGPSSPIFPSLELIDLSTSWAPLGPAFKAFVLRHPYLKYLILDRCALFTGPTIPVEDCAGLVHSLGKTLSSIGVARALECTRAWRNLTSAKAELVKTMQKIERESSATRSRRNEELPSREAVRERLHALRNLPTKFILMPCVSNLRSIAAGVEEIYTKASKKEWIEAFENGWSEGLAAAKESLDDKFGQLRRAEAKGEMDWQSGDGMMLRFMTSQEAKQDINIRAKDEENKPYSSYDAFAALLCQHQLVPCSREEAEQIYLDLTESSCVFCVEPDCSAVGGVTDVESQIASPFKSSVPFSSLRDLDQASWRKPASEHAQGCGHMLARSIWDE